MYTLQCSYIIVIKTVRSGIPMMTPLIAADLGFSEAESALVLSGFFQGYTLTQIPAAPIVQRYTAVDVKVVLTAPFIFHHTSVILSIKYTGAG